MLKKLLAVCLISTTASATTFSTDNSDLWYSASEPGWGVNVIQQGNILFATMLSMDEPGPHRRDAGSV